MPGKRKPPLQTSVSAVFEEISSETILSAAASGQSNPILVRKSRVVSGTPQAGCSPIGGPLLLLSIGNDRLQVWTLASDPSDLSPCDTTTVIFDGNNWALAPNKCFLINSAQYTTTNKGILKGKNTDLRNLLSWNEIGRQ
jgi:hypothetical protein